MERTSGYAHKQTSLVLATKLKCASQTPLRGRMNLLEHSSRPKKYFACLGSFLAGTFVLVSLPFARAQAPQADAKASIDRGKQQFVQSCAFCHGADATGARGPDLVRSPLVAHDVKGDLIGEVIKNGRPDKGMPPLPATPEQIADIA